MDNGMKVMDLSMKLTQLNPLIDSEKKELDGKVYRDVFIEVRSGVKVLARVDETTEGIYTTDFKGYRALSDTTKEKLHQLLDEYTQTPVNVRLAK